MDLSTLDPTQPPGTQAVSLGDDRMRETRQAVITSFGIEHALTGEHKFLIGTTASRPAAGHVGRLYFNLEVGDLEIDNGSAWAMAPVQPKTANSIAGSVTVPSAFTTVITNTIPLTNGIVRSIGQFQVNNIRGVGYRIVINGVNGFSRVFGGPGTSTVSGACMVMEHSAINSPGIYLVALQCTGFGEDVIISDRTLVSEVI